MDTALEPCVVSEDEQDDDEIDDVVDSDQDDDAGEDDGEEDASEDDGQDEASDDDDQDDGQEEDGVDDEIDGGEDEQGEQCDRTGFCEAYSCELINELASYTAQRVDVHNERRDRHVDTSPVTANL